ncbi:MAG: ATP-binding protein, partial [Rhodospirillales bacterium]|nr:ATP-binding protein [Rhodospirillales bacterium]
LVLIASVLLSRSVTTPLTQVASGLRRLSEGDSAVEIPRIHRRDELGDLVHAMGAFHDSLQDRQRLIRELENQNEILAESEARFRDLAELLPETIFEVDDKGRITYANRAAFSAFGRPESDVDKGISLFDLFSKRDHPRVIRNVGRVMKGEVLGANEYLACRADGTTFSVLIRSVAVLRDGRPVGLRGIMFDISERIAAEQRELGLRAEIAHVSRLSTMGEMAAGFAHELNQPLAAIRNYARGCLRRLEGGETDAAAFEMAMEKISEESSRAGEIIRRIRDFIHKRKPENVLFDMEHLIRDVVEIQASEMRHASVDIEVSIEKDLPEVLGDPITVRQVLLNLVRNAAEVLANWSGSKRHILVSASRSMDQWIKVAVADSGPGIPEDLLSKIFEPFFSTKDNGTGMGLSICRTIVESHGGRLEVETPAEGGTRFWFRLPVEAR